MRTGVIIRPHATRPLLHGHEVIARHDRARSVILSVSLTLLLRTGTSQQRAPAPDPSAAHSLQELESRLSALEERVEELRPSLAAYEAPSQTPARRTDLAERALDERLAMLERRLHGIESVPGAGSPEPEPANAQEERIEHEEAVRDARAVLADPAAKVAEKLAAHAALRRVVDAYTPAMVRDLVQIGANDPDAAVRSDVWRYFDGSSHLPELVPSLLQAMSGDPDPSVRAEASETLGNYLDDPAALAALRYTARFDERPEVRMMAMRTLAEWTWLTSAR
jgi:hypothetical protein